jgi:tetratricopeptide (TPR) repeat protein
MKRSYLVLMLVFALLSVFSPAVFSQQSPDPITAYYKHLKESKEKGGAETAFMSVGSDMLSALEYFEAKNYSAASWNFNAILRKEPENPYANFLYGACLAKLDKSSEAKSYIEKAAQLMPALGALAKAQLSKLVAEEPVSLLDKDVAQQGLDPISAYYNRLKESKTRGDAETAFLSVGNDMLYALEYFEAKNYDAASRDFNAILRKEPQNAYANFLYGASLAKLGKGKEAKPYLEKSAQIMPALNEAAKAQISKLVIEEPKSLFEEDNEKAKAEAAPAPQPIAKTPAAKPAADPKAGGKLVLGSYVCDYQQYQGSNGFGAAYKSVYQGYFFLKADGTYRWLDNGGTGKYKYDAKTGKITWLSGHMKTIAPLSTNFTDGQKVASIKVKFSDNYTWGCGCNK